MPPSPDTSLSDVISVLRRDHPDAPFLALGQTALWDEPVKAVWRRALDAYAPEATLIAGVHDTDYFAKTSAHLGDDTPYVLLPHDDGRFRDLWSAAGELSSLFGSESVPTRHLFLSYGVPFDRLAKSAPDGKAAFLAQATAAPGWRGIVSTRSRSVIAQEVPMREIGPALLDQLDWGFGESLACLADPRGREAGETLAAKVRGWVSEFWDECTDKCRLSDLYRTLLPKFYSLLLGQPPAQFQTTSSTRLFRFAADTASLARFQYVNHFLSPATAHAARRAYDEAVAGSGIYTLEAFGEGAIPFDLVIPGHGRGTIHLRRGEVVIDTAPTVTRIPCPDPVTDVTQFAALIERHLGTECCLVGKAVTLVGMIASEFLIVFHETASGYTGATRRLNQGLAAAGANLALKPIVRLQYATWDSLAAAPEEARLRLPDFLASAFGREEIAAREFAARWRSVVEGQRTLLRESRAPKKLRDLLVFLDAKTGDGWCARLEEYEAALGTLKRIAAQAQVLKQREAAHRDEARIYRQERLALEARMGEDWRRACLPLREQRRAAETPHDTLDAEWERQMALRERAFARPIAEARERIDAATRLAAQFRRERRRLERGPDAAMARQVIARIADAAQRARLDLVRRAWLAAEALEHTDCRPTAWWFPLVTPGGEWFEALSRTAQARLEPLL